MKQTIAIVGAAGSMGAGIARNLANAGHSILLAGSRREKLIELLGNIKSVTPHADVEILDCAHEASWEADIIIPAVPYTAQREVANKIRDVATGKIVISIVNPLNETIDGLVTAPTTSAAEKLAVLLPYSKIVKAFNTVTPADFNMPDLGGSRVDCFVAGDDASAVETVAGLVKQGGFRPIVAGKLSESRTLEAMALHLIRLSMNRVVNATENSTMLQQAT